MNDGLICISVCASTAVDLLANIRRAELQADLIEVRFDCLAKHEITSVLRSIRDAEISTPLIATYRASQQGGNNADLTRQQRLEFWRSLGDGFSYVDLEETIIGDVSVNSQIIASHHDFAMVPSDTNTIYDRLAIHEPSVIKIAAAANDICDAIPIWKLLERSRTENRNVIPLAMGEPGKWTRILGLAHGTFLTYASLDQGKETAGGQLTADDLINVYRVKDLDRDTRVYGVIGDPVSSSLSPFMHNAALAAAGIDAVFLPLEVKDLDAFMHRMVLPATREVKLNFAGFAVTMPHKQAVMRYLDDTDPAAKSIGAVNTVKIEGDKLLGYNTDGSGFISSLKQHLPDLWGAHIAVIGAGGAARAVVHMLNLEGAEPVVFSRNMQDAGSLSEELGAPVFDISRLSKYVPNYVMPVGAGVIFDAIVNTTPLGMLGPHETKTPLTANELSGVRFVYDLVTRRDDTPLLREAKKAGVDAIGGIEMLISQGIKQFEIWTGNEAPADLMRQAVLARLK